MTTETEVTEQARLAAEYQARRVEQARARVNDLVPAAASRAERIAAAGQYLQLTSDADGKVQNVELHAPGSYRCGVGTCKRGEEARQEFEGPLVPGPWAYAYELCTMIASSRVAHTPCIEVADGDVIALDGIEYRVRAYRRDYIALDRIEKDGRLTPAGWTL